MSNNSRYKKAGAIRKPPSREENPLILIVCEGSETEPNYFEEAINGYGLHASQVKVFGKECGSNPRTIVKFAKEKKSKFESDGQEVDTVWCVFDKDQHEWLAEAIDQANANNFKVAFSNPSFELWYLIHYQDQEAHIERDKAKSILKKNHIKNYEKSSKGLFKLLEDRLPAAGKRANKLRKMHKRNTNPPTSNPSTNVDELIEFLKKHGNSN